MITLEQIKDLRQRLATLEACLDIEGKRKAVAEKELKSQQPDFWDDPKEAEKFLKKLSALKLWVTDYDKAASLVDDLDVLYEFAKESITGESDEEAVETAETKELDEAFKQINCLGSGKTDDIYISSVPAKVETIVKQKLPEYNYTLPASELQIVLCGTAN